MRAVVKVVPVAAGPATAGHMAVCHTGGCGWTSPVHVVKQGAVDEARWHRESHRTTNG